VIGGAERVVQALAESARDGGFTPVVVTTTPDADYDAEVNGVRVHYLSVRNLYWTYSSTAMPAPLRALWHGIDTLNPLMAARVKSLLDDEKPDIVHTHNLTGISIGAWYAAAATGTPTLHTLHDYSLLCPRATLYKNDQNCTNVCLSCRPFSSPKRVASRLVNTVVGVSRYVLDRHIDAGFFPSAERHVIHNGVAEHPAPTLPMRNGTLTIGFIGRLTPSKGVDDVLRAMCSLPTPEWRVLIAGTGEPEYTARLRATFADSRIVFLGYVDARQVYEAADVIVVPSRWQEPLGNVVLEAFAAGRPVIAAARGGIPEMVTDGTGFLYEPNQANALQQCVQRFFDDPTLCARMGATALARSKHFSRATMQRRYLELARKSVGRT
jgi:glycosyltransferase involved in cell wall biosynthesis